MYLLPRVVVLLYHRLTQGIFDCKPNMGIMCYVSDKMAVLFTHMLQCQSSKITINIFLKSLDQSYNIYSTERIVDSFLNNSEPHNKKNGNTNQSNTTK
jgi:hypothetical protein